MSSDPWMSILVTLPNSLATWARLGESITPSLWHGPFLPIPGISCLATITLSLRDRTSSSPAGA
jgi:hypothetical protein